MESVRTAMGGEDRRLDLVNIRGSIEDRGEEMSNLVHELIEWEQLGYEGHGGPSKTC